MEHVIVFGFHQWRERPQADMLGDKELSINEMVFDVA